MHQSVFLKLKYQINCNRENKIEVLTHKILTLYCLHVYNSYFLYPTLRESHFYKRGACALLSIVENI